MANRVSKIVQSTSPTQWHHVQSEDNPADLTSRGMVSQELISSDLWWHGPKWLRTPKNQWRISNQSLLDIIPEQRSIKAQIVTNMTSHIDLLERFSDLGRALRVLAYVLRFSTRSKKAHQPFSSQLGAPNLKTTSSFLASHCTSRRESTPCSTYKVQILDSKTSEFSKGHN